MIKQDREDMHQAIVDRSWSQGVKQRSISKYVFAMAMPMLAAFGILIGVLIMEARAGSSEVNTSFDTGMEPLPEEPAQEELAPSAPEEKIEKTVVDTGSGGVNDGNKSKKGTSKNTNKNNGNRKGRDRIPKVEKEPEDDIFGVLDKCGDDPMCGIPLNKK